MPRENNSPIKPLGAKIKDCLANTLNVNLFVYGLFLCLMVCIGAITNNQYSIINIKEAKAEGIAQTVNYQARLMNSSGINVGDGTYSMKISIYSQASGGSHLWSASTTNGLPTGTPANIQVEVKNGLFSILLGDTNNGQVAFPEGLFNNDTLYLGITVGADSEMTPRKRLSAVPYAYNSQTLQGQYASNTVASTGGDLFALHQSSNDSASAERTALAIYTSGTNNLYDLLIKANSGSDVFSVSRQGSVTTTGNLQVDGITQLGSTLSVAATSSLADLSLSGRVNSNLLPYITDTYSLGNSTYRWLGLYAQNVTTTNLAADYVTTTELWVNGVQVTGAGSQDLDQVTDIGNITNNAIGVGGVSSTGDILPTQTLTYDLGSSAYKWRNIYTNDLTTGDLNISPRNPTYVKGLDWGYVYAIDVMGKYAYLGHTQVGVNEFTIFDVSDNANPQALGGVDVGTNHIVYDVEVVGQYAYIAQTSDASGSKEIQLIDVSNPNVPTKVSGVNTAAAECNDVLVSGNYVYAACYNVTDSVADLYIIDYTDKNNPVVTTSTNITADNAYSLAKYGDYLIVGTDDATNYNVGADILIFNVANPYLATYVGGYNVGTNPITAMELLGNNLYVGSLAGVNGYEFMIFDVGDPANVTYKGGVDLYTDYVRGIQAGTEYVTVLQDNGVGGGADLYTINVASTTNPSINSSMDVGAGGFHTLKADGTKLYIGGTNETISGQYTALEFLIFDQSGVITPSADIGDLFAGNMNVSQDARFNKDVYINSGLTVGDYGINTFGQLSVASTSKFLSLMRTSDIRPLTHDTYDLGTDAFRYQDAYFSRTVETEPTTAVRLGGYNVGGTVTATYVQGKYLYVGTQDETVTGRTEDFQIYDISDPNNPQYISGVNIGGSYSVNAIQVIGSYAYLTYFISGNNSGALYVYDVSDPKNIVYKDHIINSINSNPYALAVNGDYAYYLSHDSGTTNRLSVVNVSNPGDITLQKTINMTGGTFQSSLTVANGNLYVGSTNVTTYSSYDLIVFNLDNPGNPVYAGGANIDADGIYEVYVSGRYAYIGTTADNIYIVDISSTTVPTIVETIDAGGNDIQKIRLMDKYMVVGTVNNGTGAVNEVLVYDVSSSTNVGSPIMEINVGGSTIRDMVLYGKNLIVGTLNATTNAEDFQIYDLGGIKAQAADIGSLRSSLLRVTEDGYIGNNLYAGQGVYSDLGGLHTTGELSVKATSTFTNLQATGRVNSHWLPYLDSAYDLGNATYRWRNLYGVNATFTNLYVSNDSNTNAFIQDGNSFGEIAVLGTNDNNELQFETNGTVKMILDTAGNLDIGDGMIGTPLGDTSILLTKDGGDVFLETWSSDMSEGLVMRGDGTADYGVVRQLFGGGYTNGWAQGLHIYTGNKAGVDDPIIFTTGGFERMRIGETGNLYPTTDNTYDLGLPTNAWKNGYFDTAVNIGYQSGLSNVKFPRTGFFTASPTYNASGLDGLGFVFTVTSTLGNDNGMFVVTDKDYNLAIFAKNATSVALVGDHVEEFNITLGGDTGPRQHNSYNLGSDNRAWNHIYSSSTLYLGQATDGSAIKFTTSGYMAATPPGTDGTAAFAFWPTAYTPGSALFAVLDRPMGAGVGVPLFIQSATSVAFGGTDTEDDFLITTHGHVGPKTTYTYDLGSQDLAWRNLYTQRVSSTAVTVNGWLTQTATSPTLASTINTSDSSTFNLGVSISGNMVAVASYNNGQVRLYRINPDDSLTYLTGITFSGPDAVKLLGDRLYVSTELGAFHIYDVSDINNPVSLGSITGTGNGGKWFDIVGSYIYLAKDWSSDEFEIYDISNPANIQNVGGYATTTMDFRNIKVSGKYAYSASYSNSAWHKGLMRFDISDPKNVTYVTNYQDDYVVGFDIVGDVAYTINTAGTLRALDISSTTMSLIGSASKTVSGYNTKLIARGNMIYVLGDNNYLSIYKHLGGSNFQTIYTASDGTYWASAKAMDISGNRLVVHGGSTRNVSLWKLNGTTLDSLDVANATVGSLQVLEDVNITSDLLMGGRLHAMGGALFEGDSAFRGGIKNVPLDPKFKYYYGSLGIGGESLRTIVRGDYQYTLDWGGTYLVIHDISNGKESPYIVGALSLGYTGGDLFINGQYAYVTYNAGILPGYKVNVYDISNPASISLVSSRAVAAGTNGTTNSIVQTRGSLMYLLTSYSDSCVLNTVDISDPRSMRSIDTYTVSASYACRDMAIRDKYLYALTAATIHKIDITIPRSTFEAGNAGTVSLNPQYSLDIKGSYLYVWKTNSNTGIISTYYINDTELELFHTATVTGAGNGELRVAGDYAYVVTKTTTDGVSMLHIFNVAGSSVPAVPILSKDLSSMGEDSYRFDISGDTIYLASEARSRVYALDLGGINSHAASIGSLEAYRANIKGDANIDRELHVFGGSTLGGRVNMNKGGSANMNGDTDDDVTTSSPYNNYVISNEVFSVIDGRNLTYSDAIDTSYIYKTALFVAATGTYSLGSGDNGRNVGVAVSVPGYVSTGAGMSGVGVFSYLNGGGDPRTNIPTMPSAAGVFAVDSSVSTAYGLYAYSTNNNSVPTAQINNWSSGSSARTLVLTQGCSSGATTPIFEVYSGSGGDRELYVNCSGATYADGSYFNTGADYAEYMMHENKGFAAGDVAVLDLGHASSVKMAELGLRNQIVGVVSNNASVVGNVPLDIDSNEAVDSNKWVIVGMLGQLPTKFSNINGSISVGDKLMAGDNGYAVKAVGSGMVLGEALESTSATGTVMLYLHPHWWAGDLLDSDGSVNYVQDDLAFKATGLATTSTQGFGSNNLYFNGSGWNSINGQAVATGFAMGNRTTNATTSVFEITFATGTSDSMFGASRTMLSITNAGDMSVTGDLTVGRRLYLGSKTTGQGSTSTYLFVDDTLAPTSTYISTNADGWQTEDTYDYAERYESDQELSPGDIVTADGSGINKVKKATSIHEPVLGIVSTKPGFVTGRHYEGWYPIALAGRVPTRVSTLNGAIKVGDQLSASDMPGVAVKALGAGNVIGIALESYDKYEEGLISVFVKPGYMGGMLSEQTTAGGTTIINQTTNTTVADKVIEGLALIKAGASEVNISFATLQAYPMIYATPHSSVDGSWYIANRKDNGFTIITSEPQTHDVEFTWMARPMKAGTIKFVSDNTYHAVDDLTGQMYGPINPTDTATTTEPVIDPATTSTEPLIVTDEPQTLPEPPEETADTPTSTTNTQNQNSTTTQT